MGSRVENLAGLKQQKLMQSFDKENLALYIKDNFSFFISSTNKSDAFDYIDVQTSQITYILTLNLLQPVLE